MYFLEHIRARTFTNFLLLILALISSSCQRRSTEEIYFNHASLSAVSLAEESQILNTNFNTGDAEELYRPKYENLDVVLSRKDQGDNIDISVYPKVSFAFSSNGLSPESWEVEWQFIVRRLEPNSTDTVPTGYLFTPKSDLALDALRRSSSLTYALGSTLAKVTFAPMMLEVGRQYSGILTARVASKQSGVYWEVNIATIAIDLRSLKKEPAP
ncbi:MAG: hypothetical protein H6617_05050 [Bdellovibrionaceae bacterium]|nr:hypothetical protein [Bdellovibrionales bacterium]MCB9254031.1 hypothetical protein [Pseudobdellovibrionaceae bacterium]